MPGRAPVHAVRKVLEVEGPRGGLLHVLVLECGAYMTKRLKGPPPAAVPCIACFVRAQAAAELPPATHVRSHSDRGMLALCGERLFDDDPTSLTGVV
jgi:hypothetical protein